MKKVVKVLAVVVIVLGLGIGVASVKDVIKFPQNERNLADPTMGG